MQALIVDDEEDMRFLVRMTIEVANHGMVVSGEAASGAEALDLIGLGGHDVVVVDQRMPGMTGIELCARVLAEQPELPMVLYSAVMTNALRTEAQGLGVRACLSKEDVFKLPETLRDLVA